MKSKEKNISQEFGGKQFDTNFGANNTRIESITQTEFKVKNLNQQEERPHLFTGNLSKYK